MKKINFLLALFMFFSLVSLEAQILGKRWFVELSAGGGKIYGPALMKKFNLKNELSLELGYMLTENIGVIPASVSFYNFNRIEGFFGNSIRSSVDEYIRKVGEINWRKDINFHPLNSSESISSTQVWMKSSSYSPGLLFTIPVLAELRGYTKLGMIYNNSRLYIENTIIGDDNYALKGPHKQSSKNLGLYLGGGMEYVFGRRYALNVYGSYSHIFTKRDGRNPEIDPLDNLEFYYAGEGRLELTSYPGLKNTKYFQFRGSCKVYFGL